MIELKKVSFQYGTAEQRTGLVDIDLTIPAGQTVLLCGESGCGKTTLTRLLNGLIPHYYEGTLTGKIQVNGLDTTAVPLCETSAVVGSVFQNPRSQFFNVDTTSELAFGCENQGLDEAEIHARMQRTVQEFGLKNLMDRSIFALSGGEKQKIACACVSALDPEIFVLDEPSSNLDTSATAELAQMIGQWKSQGKTVVISEHRLYYLRPLVDRMIYMKKGRIIKDFTREELQSLSGEGMEKLGLRPLSLEGLSKREPCRYTYRSGAAVTFSNMRFGYQKSDTTINVKDMSLPQGSVTAVIGHNGAGKSTFARCICGLEKKCGGILSCRNIVMKSKKRLKHCYMVMQDVNHQLFTESVLDEVLISMDKEDIGEANRILDSLNLLELKELHPVSLSGGQKQRVAIASALASNREIILFDEPTSGLDLRHMREVARNIKELSRRGKTLLVITHDPELILACCTHILQLEQGEAVASYSLRDGGVVRMLSFFEHSKTIREG